MTYIHTLRMQYIVKIELQHPPENLARSTIKFARGHIMYGDSGSSSLKGVRLSISLGMLCSIR